MFKVKEKSPHSFSGGVIFFCSLAVESVVPGGIENHRATTGRDAVIVTVPDHGTNLVTLTALLVTADRLDTGNTTRTVDSLHLVKDTITTENLADGFADVGRILIVVKALLEDDILAALLDQKLSGLSVERLVLDGARHVLPP